MSLNTHRTSRSTILFIGEHTMFWFLRIASDCFRESISWIPIRGSLFVDPRSWIPIRVSDQNSSLTSAAFKPRSYFNESLASRANCPGVVAPPVASEACKWKFRGGFLRVGSRLTRHRGAPRRSVGNLARSLLSRSYTALEQRIDYTYPIGLHPRLAGRLLSSYTGCAPSNCRRTWTTVPSGSMISFECSDALTMRDGKEVIRNAVFPRCCWSLMLRPIFGLAVRFFALHRS